MSSEKAQYIVNMMRKMKTMPKPEGPPDYGKRRAFVEARHAQQKTAEGVTFEALSLGGVEVECSTPAAPINGGAVLYLHGGGFVTGSARTSRGYASYLAQATGLRVYAVSYRLAPDDPWPAAPEDCLAAYKALLERHPDGKLALVGGSAGGNLCLSTALRARDAGLPLPAALALFSPVGDMTNTLPSRRSNAERDCTIQADIDVEHQTAYLQGADPCDPLISPVYAGLTGFPPMLIYADGSEVLLDDSALLFAHAQRDGVEAELHITSGLFHDFPSVGSELPEAAQVMDEVAAFLRRCGCGKTGKEESYEAPGL